MKGVTASLIFILLLCSPLYSFDWKGEGLAEKSSTISRDGSILELSDSKGGSVVVKYSGSLDDSDAKMILEIRKAILSWKNIRVKRIRFLVSQAGIDIVAFPDSFMCEGKDMLVYVPAGIHFSYTDSLEYNFRITLENLFIRIRGSYIDEIELCTKIIEAVNNPREYIRKRDPEYFLSKLDMLEKNYSRLEKDYQMLRTAVMALHNTGFFRGTTPVSIDVITRTVELKKSDPSITDKKILEVLKKEKIKATGKEVSLVLEVYFNEFK